MIKNIDKFRAAHLALAEAIDAWRMVPRLLMVGYAWLLWTTINWYMNLKPYVPGELMHLVKTTEDATKLMVEAPTTQHAVLVSAVVGVAAIVIGLYTNTGRTWSEGIKKWEDDESSSD